MPRTQAYSPGEHHELGRDLQRIYSELIELHVAYANRYPKTNQASNAFRRLIDQIATVRSKLDSQFAIDHPNEFRAAAYYPSNNA